jgi:hypothetical protein
VNTVLGRPRRCGFDETSRRGYCNDVIARVASSFVFLMVLLTLLGHACELPIGALLAARPDAVLHAPAPLRIGPSEALVVSAVARESHAVRRGRPLFLLHSALLI